MRRSEEFYEGDRDVVYSQSGRGETMQEVLARRWSRRGVIKGGGLATVALTLGGTLSGATGAQEASPVASSVASPVAGATGMGTLGFEPISLDAGDTPVVARGHRAFPLLKWGDPLFVDAPEFELNNQSAASQERQFGYNCDWIGFFPLPVGSTTSDNGLLVVNHEYTNPELMFPNYFVPNPDFATPVAASSVAEDSPAIEEIPEGEEVNIPAGSAVTPVSDVKPDSAPPEIPEFLTNPTKELVDVELAAHGLSVVEVRRNEAGDWEVVRDSQYNRRLTGMTEMEVTGPAAGHDWMKTPADATGTRVFGTLNNCAGGTTPWGTALTGEENFQQYFGNLAQLPAGDPIRVAHERYGLEEEASERGWELFYDRFDLTKEPTEPFRFGWVVEFDPYDPQSVPKKRTAIGRVKHEGATHAVAPGGQVAIYSGDDERFDYAYKFVTAGAYNPNDRAANANLLDEGTLYVGKFNDDGTGEWLPLVWGVGPLTVGNGFTSQADLLIRTRQAADAVGATKMDRPEDFETNPVTGKVYLVCTNNSERALTEIEMANPRPNNFAGHIIEITESNNDHASTTFNWEIFILAGDPENGATWYGGLDPEEFSISPFAAPDNLTFDTAGHIWISTDGLPNNLPGNDGLFVAPTEGEERGRSMQFFSTVPGAECSGPVFNPDNTALFVSVQHPGEGGTIDDPVSLWPTGEGTARPTVMVITGENAMAKVGRGLV